MALELSDELFLELAPLGKVPPTFVELLRDQQRAAATEGRSPTLFALLRASGRLNAEHELWFLQSAQRILAARAAEGTNSDHASSASPPRAARPRVIVIVAPREVGPGAPAVAPGSGVGPATPLPVRAASPPLPLAAPPPAPPPLPRPAPLPASPPPLPSAPPAATAPSAASGSGAVRARTAVGSGAPARPSGSGSRRLARPTTGRRARGQPSSVSSRTSPLLIAAATVGALVALAVGARLALGPRASAPTTDVAAGAAGGAPETPPEADRTEAARAALDVARALADAGKPIEALARLDALERASSAGEHGAGPPVHALRRDLARLRAKIEARRDAPLELARRPDPPPPPAPAEPPPAADEQEEDEAEEEDEGWEEDEDWEDPGYYGGDLPLTPPPPVPRDDPGEAAGGGAPEAGELPPPAADEETAWAALDEPTAQLLLAALEAFDREAVGALREAVAGLEQRGDGPALWTARGLLHFTEGEFSRALEGLERAEALAGARGRMARALAAFYLGRHEEAYALADPGEGEPFPGAPELRTLIEGPFGRSYPHAAAALVATTPKGRYRVMTDLGLDAAALDALDRKLAALDEDERGAAAERARRGHAGLREVCSIMDQAYVAYDKLFAQERREELVPTVYVFARQPDFARFSRRLRVGDTENTLGYYLPGYRVLVFFDQDEPDPRRQGLLDQGSLETLMHETFHQWIHLYVPDPPTWFNEGMAEYFSTCELTKRRLRYGLIPSRAPSRLTDIREALAGIGRRPFDLASLLRADRATWGSRPFVNYAQAWSVCHFLASSDGGRKLLRDYFRALQAGADIEEAYRRVFGAVDVTALEASWKDYVARLR